MASFLTLLFVASLIAAVVLQLMGRRSASGWLVVVFPAFLCGAALLDLSHGAAKLGAGAYESDLKQLGYCSVLLAMSLLAALQSRSRWLFWVAWACSSVVCGMLVYLAFFWKVFS